MRKLIYSREGFVRRVRMSRDTYFLLVEGKVVDPFFFGEICKNNNKVRSSGYQIWPVAQANGGGSGKKSLLDMFDYCRARNSLMVSNSTGRKALVFCADRDADHITRGMKNSPHMMYTTSADVESEIFLNGVDEIALAVSASLDEHATKNLVDALGDWRMSLADNLRAWIKLCCLAKRTSTFPKGIGFGSNSTVNSSNFGEIDESHVQFEWNRIASECQLDSDVFARENIHVELAISRIYRRGGGFSLVKGKWVPRYLAFRLREHFGNYGADLTGIEKILTKCYLHTLDFGDIWSEPYHVKLNKILT